jgi:hypothetical protein
MKSHQTPEDERSLRRVLEEWKVNTPLPLRFQEDVWSRIEQAERHPEPSTGVLLLRLVGEIFGRPRFALAYVALLLALGVVGGVWAAQLKTSHLDSNMRLRYVQAVDPFRGGEARQ